MESTVENVSVSQEGLITEKELNLLAKELCQRYFQEEFNGIVQWSNRMTKITGNCRQDGRIGLNYNYYLYYGKEEIIQVLLHELCHYYCFQKVGWHDHSTPLFLEYLNKTGARMKGKPLPVLTYHYECSNCDNTWFFLKKLKKAMSCKDCGGNEFHDDSLIRFKEEKWMIA